MIAWSFTSVFSEAFLVLERAPRAKLRLLVNLTALRLSLFLDFIAKDCHVREASWIHVGRRKIWCFYCWLSSWVNTTNRCSFKRRFQWNGGHIVFWSNLDLGCEIPAIGLICKSCRSLSNPLFDQDDSQSWLQCGYLYAQSIELDESFPKRHSSSSLAASRRQDTIVKDNGNMVHLMSWFENRSVLFGHCRTSMHQRCPSQKVRHSSLFRQNQKSAQSASKTKNPPHKWSK